MKPFPLLEVVAVMSASSTCHSTETCPPRRASSDATAAAAAACRRPRSWAAEGPGMLLHQCQREDSWGG